MKKLMIAAAIVCAAAFVQAATVTWSISNVYAGNSTDLASGIAYILDASTALDTSTWKDAASATTWLNANALGKGGTAFTWQGVDGNYSMTTKTDPADLGLTVGSTKYQLYAVVFDTETVTDDSSWFMTGMNSKSKSITDSTVNTAFDLGGQGAKSQIASNWNTFAAVPEPTSGLLLLLGVAGLALKRRHA